MLMLPALPRITNIDVASFGAQVVVRHGPPRLGQPNSSSVGRTRGQVLWVKSRLRDEGYISVGNRRLTDIRTHGEETQFSFR